MRKKLLLTLPLTLILTGCFHVPDDLNNSTLTEVQEISFTTVEQGVGSYPEATPRLFLIQTQDQLDQLWSIYITGNILNPNPAPQIDFGATYVIAAFSGQKNTGGYSIDITGVNTNAQSGTSDIAVYATLNSPAPDAFVTQSLTSPYHVVQLERQAGFQFEDVYMILTDENDQTTQIVSVSQNDF